MELLRQEKLTLIFRKILFEKILHKFNRFNCNCMNPWLCEILRKYNVKVYKSKVGDRNVLELKREKKIQFLVLRHQDTFVSMMPWMALYSTGIFLNILNDNPELIDEVLNIDINYEKLIYAIDERYLKYLQNLK